LKSSAKEASLTPHEKGPSAQNKIWFSKFTVGGKGFGSRDKGRLVTQKGERVEVGKRRNRESHVWKKKKLKHKGGEAKWTKTIS